MMSAQVPVREPRRYLPIVVVAIVAIAIGAGVFLRDSFSEGYTPATAPPSVALEGNGMLNQPTDQGSTSSEPGKSSVGSAQRLTPAQRMERMQARRQEMKANTQKLNDAGRQKRIAKFNSEGKDPGWASATERSLDNVISDERLASYGVKDAETKVDCRTTICRITSILPDSSQADDWTTLYMTNVGTSLPNAYVTRKTLPDGRIQVEVMGVGGRN